MNFNIVLKRKNYDEHFSEDEYEDVTKLYLILEELKFLYEGYLKLDFGENKILNIDYDFEFIVEHKEFLEITDFLEDNNLIEYNIWFCEQGADYHIKHKKEGKHVVIELKKGANSGLDVDEFKIKVLKEDYKRELIKLFRKLFLFISTKLPKYKDSEEILKYINNTN